MVLSGVQCVLVHHRNFPAVLDTVGDLLSQGVVPQRLLVVDNSEDAPLAASLRESLPAGVQLCHVRNQGYAAAVNAGVRRLPGASFTLVSTHEVALHAGALGAMRTALVEDDRIAVVGPVLLVRDSPGELWSAGGQLTKLLRLPKHRRSVRTPEIPYDVAWLDGALCLYRTDVLRASPLREDFFLYYEETELHTRLRRQGWRAVLVPNATAEQHSAGMPPYYSLRNAVLFQHLHGTPLSRVGQMPYALLRAAAMVAAGRSSSADLRDLLLGWRDGKRLARRPTR